MAIDDFGTTQHFAYVLQLSLGIVFMLAAIPKLHHPAAFTRTLQDYELVPRAITRALAASVVAIEAFLAVAFLTGWMTAIAVPLAASVLLVFSAAVAVNLQRGRRVACGCFGGASERISLRSLVRLSMLLSALLLLAAMPTSPVTVDALIDEGRSAFAYLVQMGSVAAFLIIVAVWLLNLPELFFTPRHLCRHEAAHRREPSEEAA